MSARQAGEAVLGDCRICDGPKAVRPIDIIGDQLPIAVCRSCKEDILGVSGR